MVYIKSSSACEYFDYDNDKEKGSEKLDYIYANGKIWSEVVTSESTKNTYYHHTDHLGTTVCITDSTCKLLDENTNLYYFNARWYDSDIGRFISEDPARYGANWYGYAGQNPMVYVDPTGLAPYINGIYDGDYNPDYNPGVPVEGPKTQEQQKYYEPQGPTALPNSLDFRIEPIYNFYGDFVGYGAEGEQRAEAFEKTQFFYFHFEGRNKRNIITETFDEIYNSSQSKNGDWFLLDYNMSLLHQNEKGSAELKFICKDGREAVFTKDFSKDGSYELYTDPRYVGTFNYCNPVPAPKGISDVKGLFNFIGKSIIGHGCLDVIPYYVTGKRNVRDSAKIVK